MKDEVVVASLRKRGANINDMQEILRYEAIERQPRHLDKAPKRLSFVKAESIETYGCCSEFIMRYNDLRDQSKLEQATIDMHGHVRLCDVEVYLALKALIEQGFTNTEEIAMACFDVFKALMTAPGDVLTIGSVYSVISKPISDNYYVKELVNGLRVCLFNEKAPVLHWISLCESVGCYNKAIELGRDVISRNCKTEKDVEKFLRPIYKEASSDKEFMGKIYKPAANKWLIPMIYILQTEHPEVLDSSSPDGFHKIGG